MDKASLKKVIGENIRIARIKKDMSIDELSELLDLTPGFVGLIERGQRGATAYTLHKLSEIFQIKIDTFFNERFDGLLVEEEDPAKIKREKISTILYDLEPSELDFIIDLIKSLKQMQSNSLKSASKKISSHSSRSYQPLTLDEDE